MKTVSCNLSVAGYLMREIPFFRVEAGDGFTTIFKGKFTHIILEQYRTRYCSKKQIREPRTEAIDNCQLFKRLS